MKNRYLMTPILVLVVLLFGSTSIIGLQSSFVSPNNINVNQTEDRTFKLLQYTFAQDGSVPTVDMDHWKDIFKAQNPDIIVASEASHFDPSKGLLQAAIDEMNGWFPNEKPYTGVSNVPDVATDGQVVISRFPIVRSEILEDFTLDDNSIAKINHPVMHAVLDIYGVEVHFFTTHLSCCAAVDNRIRELEGIMNFIDTLGDVPIIFPADYNSDSPEDVGEVAGLYSDLGGDAIDIMINSSNPKASENHLFTDMFRTLNPHKPGWSYFDPDYDSRLDYIMVNQFYKDAMVKSETIDDHPKARTASDHYAVTGIFNPDYATSDLRPPLTVHNVAIDVDVPNVQSTISWPANTETDFYKYQVYRNVSSTSCLITEIPKGTTEFVDNHEYALDNLYYYEMTTVDEKGNISPLSHSFYANSSQSQIFKPSLPVITATGVAGGIQLNWTLADDGGINGVAFQIRRAGTINAARTHVAIVTGDSYFDPFPTAPAGLPIHYWIRAYNIVGTTFYSDVSSTTTIGSFDLNLHQTVEPNTVQSLNTNTHNNDLAQATVCPEPLNLINLPVTTTSESSSTTTSTTQTTSSSESEKSDEGDSPFNFLLISLISFNVIVFLKKKKD